MKIRCDYCCWTGHMSDLVLVDIRLVAGPPEHDEGCPRCFRTDNLRMVCTPAPRPVQSPLSP